MIYHSAEKVRVNDQVIDTVQSDVDYVDSSGDLHIHNKVAEVIVTAKTDLAGLSGYNVGTIAYTAGLANIWQLDASGEWVAILEEPPADEGDGGEEPPADSDPVDGGGE